MPTKDVNESVVEGLCDSFRPFVEELYRDGGDKYGLGRSTIEIENCKGGEFTVVLPYAGSHIRWEVIFDSGRPWFAPDFRFDDENFLQRADSTFIETHVPSLARWDDGDPKALGRVIAELMELYRHHQKESLDKSTRAHFEYATLIGSREEFENDIEVLVGKGNAVTFMIELKIDDAKLPALFRENPEENPGGDRALLLVKYPNPAKAELIMSPLVTRAVGNPSLPPIQETALLMDYVPEITELINNRIQRVFLNEKLKRELLSRLIAKYERCILQHGSESASFLFNVDDFYCILHIDLGDNFPEQPPQLTLRSIYHLTNGKPTSKILTECPYDEIEKYIREEIINFKNRCNNVLKISD